MYPACWPLEAILLSHLRTMRIRSFFAPLMGALLLPFLIIAASSEAAQDGAAQAPEKLHLIVLHTNDMHGQVVPLPATWVKDQDPPPTSGGLNRIGAYIKRTRDAAAEEGAEILVVDGGDWYQGTPEGGLDKGLGILKVMMLMGYDLVTVGNHEFDHGVAHFEEMLKSVPLPALLANARTKTGGTIPGTGEYSVLERGGLSICVVGMCSVQTPEMSHVSTRDLEWEEPADTLTRIKKELAEREVHVDFWLPVTHCGVYDDKKLAKAHPDLELIVGGHTHTVLHKGEREGRTLIVQAGSKARSIGRVDLWFDAETKSLLRGEARLVNLYGEPTEGEGVPAVAAACDELLRRSAIAMDKVIGRLDGALGRGKDAYATTASGNLITDLMRAHAGAQVAIHNRGGIRAGIEAGEVTRRDLFRILPFDNNLVTLTMTGRQLTDLLTRSLEGRGRSGLEFSGIVAQVKRNGRYPTVVALLVDGQKIVPTQEYKVTTNSFLANGGDAYIEFQQARERVTDPILQRTLLENALAKEWKEGRGLTPSAENRFVILP